MAVVVPPQFAETLRSDGHASVQALLDASDSNTASIGMGYAQNIVQGYSAEMQIDWQQRHGLAARRCRSSPFSPAPGSTRILQSMANIVPGVVAMVMAVVGAFLTSLTIAREWERGTMEQLISTPVGKLEIQIGKLIPYFVIGMIDTAICAGNGRLVVRRSFSRELAGVVRMLDAVSGGRAVAWLFHFGHGQEPARRLPDGSAGHVPSHVPALGLHFPHRSDAGCGAVDHGGVAGALLRRDSCATFS